MIQSFGDFLFVTRFNEYIANNISDKDSNVYIDFSYRVGYFMRYRDGIWYCTIIMRDNKSLITVVSNTIKGLFSNIDNALISNYLFKMYEAHNKYCCGSGTNCQCVMGLVIASCHNLKA